MPDKDEILSSLKEVNYPGFSKDIVTLGAVNTVSVEENGHVVIDMKTISADPDILDRLVEDINAVVRDKTGAVNIDVLFGGAPQSSGASCGSGHGQGHDESPFKRNKIPGVKHIVPVVSGKGGVGKSTVSVNLAYGLSQLGHKVGLLDLDLFGPSIHRMLGTKNARLAMVGDMIDPHEQWGLKVVSIGMAMGENEALIIRGPMVMKLLNQLMNEVQWGELDYLIVDMPPGTGDVPLSLVQNLDITGAVVVTTPQDISLIDVRRAVQMFKKTDTRILGVVENMSYYRCDKCGDIAHLFGHGGGERESAAIGVPFLGGVPLVKTICEAAEAGSPIVDREQDPQLADVFDKLARKTDKLVGAVTA